MERKKFLSFGLGKSFRNALLWAGTVVGTVSLHDWYMASYNKEVIKQLVEKEKADSINRMEERMEQTAKSLDDQVRYIVELETSIENSISNQYSQEDLVRYSQGYHIISGLNLKNITLEDTLELTKKFEDNEKMPLIERPSPYIPMQLYTFNLDNNLNGFEVVWKGKSLDINPKMEAKGLIDNMGVSLYVYNYKINNWEFMARNPFNTSRILRKSFSQSD